MSDTDKVLGVIPARMQATRFPGKPLVEISGMTMIQHVWERCRLSGALDHVIVATCDDEIIQAARRFGADAEMTRDTWTRANDRVAEVSERHPEYDIVVNIQGDEPVIHPELIREVADALRSRPDLRCVSPAAAIVDAEDFDSPNTVKCVWDRDMRVLFFSRFPIPYDSSKNKPRGPVYRQVPVLGFRREFLLHVQTLAETPLEQRESVDLMRPIEYGLPVHALVTTHQSVGVDTPDDRARVEAILNADPVYRRYSA
jgi:3-deoxy-manno-octulosonate cytidylyltransferase (CMP-KDO synthetase)